VDYHLMSTIPGLFVAGEANFSDHGANRLGASALMQGLADGYFVLPYTVPNYIASNTLEKVDSSHPAFVETKQDVVKHVSAIMNIGGTRTVDSLHKELGRVMWENCGMARSDKSLRFAIAKIAELRKEFWSNLGIVGTDQELNQSLEKAGRLADYLEFATLLCTDALHRTESCGGHFRIESQTPDGEAKRDDEHFSYVAAWAWKGNAEEWDLYAEPLQFEYVHLAQRSYK
jgi:succinate dehydrogenase / fumarate reductase flavoprotein subunit